MLVLTSPYIPQLVEAVKSLPYTERRYDASRKIWFVDPKHGDRLVSWVEIYTGEVVSLPLIRSMNPKSVMKLFEVKYIGACKQREDGSSSAFGLVGNDWSLIFPEMVLREWFEAGQPTPDSAPTLYAVLAVSKNATPEEIKTGYRRMALQWHPDVCKEFGAADQFHRIQEAYDILSSIGKRARYDAGLQLEATLGRRQREQINPQNGYRSPLRCGYIMASGVHKMGRFMVERIMGWEDIVDAAGRTLVSSWPFGDKQVVRQWV